MKPLSPHAQRCIPRRSFLRCIGIALIALVLSPIAIVSDPRTETKNILILGDSLTAGYGLEPEEAYPALLQKNIDAAGLPFRIVNAGVSGDTTAGGLRRINWVLKQPVHILVIELGGNDGLRGLSLDQTRANLQSIIDKAKAKYPDIRILVAGMQMPPNMGAEYTEGFRAIFPELAKKNEAALIPFLLEDVGGRPEFNLPDLIHPNAEGHKIVAENVWRVLKPMLESSRVRVGSASGP